MNAIGQCWPDLIRSVLGYGEALLNFQVACGLIWPECFSSIASLSFGNMVIGSVSEESAKHHHKLWYDEVEMGGKSLSQSENLIL